MSKLQLGAMWFIAGILAVFAVAYFVPPVPPPALPVIAKNAIAVSVCGVTPAILVAYSDGSVRNFEPPFKDVPKVPNEWIVPISVLECEGKVQLQTEVM